MKSDAAVSCEFSRGDSFLTASSGVVRDASSSSSQRRSEKSFLEDVYGISSISADDISPMVGGEDDDLAFKGVVAPRRSNSHGSVVTSRDSGSITDPMGAYINMHVNKPVGNISKPRMMTRQDGPFTPTAISAPGAVDVVTTKAAKIEFEAPSSSKARAIEAPEKPMFLFSSCVTTTADLHGVVIPSVATALNAECGAACAFEADSYRVRACVISV